ncbi:MAG: alpha-mannosidase, partial [Spirulina sp. DLM2.Bin59]
MSVDLEGIRVGLGALRDRAQVDVQNHWRSYLGDLPSSPPPLLPGGEKGSRIQNSQSPSLGEGFRVRAKDWPWAEANEKGYLVWERGEKVRWFWQTFTVPPHLKGYPLQGLQLRLCLTWWAADAQVFCNGELLQAGDLFDSSARVLLSAGVEPGERFEVAIRLVSPGHDIGALMRSHLRYEAPTGELDPGFVADELAVLTQYCQRFQPEALPKIAAVLAKMGDDPIDLAQLRTPLLPLAENLKTRCFYLMGHAHLDLAWLWDLPETYDVAERTFRSVLNLQQEFPELTFCHTSPALYEWIEQHRPELFVEIQAAVAAGTWEPLGGMWVEPDVILPGGEAIARQLLYGQRYTQAKFGKITQVAWLTDSFGFPWQLPQLLAQAGIRYFVTQKLHWNDRTKFPHGFFRWQAPDGTELLTLMSPPNVTGVMDTNPITMTNYSVDWEAQTGFKDIFWLPGVGDHGGGPSRDMLAVQRRWQASPFFPKIQFTTAIAYLDRLANQGRVNPHPPAPSPKGGAGELEIGQDLPLWADELYLELHRGCYTVHADQKWFNRRCEGMLYEAELWSTIATVLTAAPYPQKELEQAWKQVLFNQFHDILPGTSIPPVFERANRDWQAALTMGETLRDQALIAISARIQCPPRPGLIPFVIFNPLNHHRIDAMEFANMGQIYDSTGGALPSQGIKGGSMAMVALPSVGYTLIWADPQPLPLLPLPPEPVLENEDLRVEIDPQTGDLAQVWHQGRAVLRGPGNQLQVFQDQ